MLDLLSTVGSRSMPVRAWIAAGELFGIDANAVRVAVARLVREGRIQSDERGAYRAGPSTRPIVAHVSDWRSLEERVCPWNGAWLGALTSALPRSDRAAVRLSERALRYFGFSSLEPGLSLRPHNLVGGITLVRSRLEALDLDPRVALFEIHDLDDARDARARTLWEPQRLNRSYRELRAKIEASGERLQRLTSAKAMRESFLIGGEALRALAQDPLLPEPLVAAKERRRLVAAMKLYDRAGRRCWSTFMRENGAPHAQTTNGTKENVGHVRAAAAATA